MDLDVVEAEKPIHFFLSTSHIHSEMSFRVDFRVARFFSVQTYQNGKIYQITQTIQILPLNLQKWP
jgi:hypothetical protein